MSDKFEPKIYYQDAWKILKKAPFLFALKLAASVASAMIWLGISVLLALPILWTLGVALRQNLAGILPGGIGATLDSVLSRLANPSYLLGISGILASAWALSLCAHALASASIWATLRRAIRDAAAFHDAKYNSLPGMRTLLKDGIAHFPRVLRLQVVVACSRALVALLGALLVTGVLLATTLGVFAGASVLTRAFLWAWPLTLLSGFALLMRLSAEVSAAPMILEELPTGRSILRGAAFVVDSFVPVYRLFLYAAQLFLLPLLFYWFVAIAQNIVFVLPGLAGLFGVLRVLGFLILFVASAIIAVLFKAAIFSYYEAVQSGAVTRAGQSTLHHSSLDSTKGLMQKPANPARIKMTQATTLEEFLPVAYPNIIPLSELIRAPEENPSDADNAEETAGLKTRPGLPGFGDFAGLFGPKSGDAETSQEASPEISDAPPKEDAPRKLTIPTPRDLSNHDIFGADDDPNS